MKHLEEILAWKYDYKKLSSEKSQIVRAIYECFVPKFLEKTRKLYTVKGTLICSDFDRIVIGDYGAYIEFSREKANKDAFIIAPGEEYRLQPRYKNIKYVWLTIDDGSNIKIYYQKHSVDYADYQEGKYYISIYEVYPDLITKILDSD